MMLYTRLPLFKWVLFSVLLGFGLIIGVVASDSTRNPDFVNALWVADHNGILKISTSDGTTLLQISNISDIQKVAIDAKNGFLWVARTASLDKYRFNGTLEFSKPYSTILFQMANEAGDEVDIESLHVDSTGKNLWLADEYGVYHLNANADLLQNLSFKEEIKSLALDENTSNIWVATETAIRRYSSTLDQLLTEILVTTNSTEEEIEVKHIAYDASLKQLWVATENALRRYDNQGALTYQSPRSDIEKLVADQKGNVWVGLEKNLIRLDPTGAEILRVDLFANDEDEEIESMVLEPSDQSIWVAGEAQLVHVDTQGLIQHTVVIQNETEDIAIYSDVISPIVKFILPVNGSYVKDNQPALQLSHDDVGIGVDTTTLSISTAGTPLSTQCTHSLNDSSCNLDNPLPEGSVKLQADIEDFAGNQAKPAEVQFTVDTIQPSLTLISPVDGSYTNQAGISLKGKSNEAASVTINHNNTSVSGITLDSTFSFDVPYTLLEGLNAFGVTLTDLAGNNTQKTYTFYLDTVPPANIATGQMSISAIANGQVTLSAVAGTAEPGTTITITNLRTGESVTVTVNADGSFSAQLAAQAGDQFSMVVADRAGNQSDTTTIDIPLDIPPDPASIAPPLDNTVATTVFHSTSFIYSGSNPIQSGVSADTIVPERAGVVRGKILDRNNVPLPSVNITVKQHNEFGSTLSRADGMFDMVVNGGETLIVNYELSGYLPIQRKIYVPWQEFAVLPDVVMIPYDKEVTTIDLNVNTGIKVARGSIVTDEDGTRQATLFFPQGVQALMEMPDGSTQPISTLNVRMTEYTVGPNGPESMPGELPPASAYTYAVELSVDEILATGAKSIRFDSPVIYYVDNFLNFFTGEAIPAGSYDREIASWIPSDNGRIIKILSVNNNGLSEIDIDGDDQPEDVIALTELGITNEERTRLAQLYLPGKSLWRTPVKHFTPWDLNWPYGPDGAAEYPKQPQPKVEEKEECSTTQTGSIIECQSQVLGERIPVAGTGLTLNYRSDRVPGRKTSNGISIPLTGSSVPSGVIRVDVVISISGRTYKASVAATPNQFYQFSWNGRGAYGRYSSSSTAEISIGYVYKGKYYKSAAGLRNGFGEATDCYGAACNVTGYVNTRKEITYWQKFSTKVFAVGKWDARSAGLGGWTLNNQHFYNPITRKLYLGNGQTRLSKNVNMVVEKFGGDNVVANEIIQLPDGSFYYSGRFNVFKITQNGSIINIAGTGGNGDYPGDGGAAVLAPLSPSGIALGPDDSLYIVDSGRHAVRHVDKNGIISTIAGNGTPGYSGDDGPSVSSQLQSPRDVAVSSNGYVYIADLGNSRIRVVSPDGIIKTIAGNGTVGFSGDGGLAISAQLSAPESIAITLNGDIVIADRGNHRIRSISRDGTINTIAGTGNTEFNGERGIATNINLNSPWGISVGNSGDILVADSRNNRVRRIKQDGTIETVIGNGLFGQTTLWNGQSVSKTSLNFPTNAIEGKNGAFYVNDGSMLLKVKPIFSGYDDSNLLVVSREGTQLYQFWAYRKALTNT